MVLKKNLVKMIELRDLESGKGNLINEMG